MASIASKAVVALAWILMLSAQTAGAGDEVVRDSWFAVSIGATRCGWMHERVERTATGVVTTNEMRMTMGRSGAQATVAMGWRFLESDSGAPIACEVMQESGQQGGRVKYTFGKDSMTIVEILGERTTSREAPLPVGRWLTPGQVEDLSNRRRLEGAGEISYTTVDPSAGMKVVEVTSRRSSPAGEVPARWTTTNSSVPMPTVELVDGSGQLIESRTSLAIGDMVAKRCDETAARKPVTGASIDVIAASVVELREPCDQIVRKSHARLRLGDEKGGKLDLPACGAQQVTQVSDTAVIVDVVVGRTSAATTDERADKSFVDSSMLVDSDAPSVVALATRALAAAHLEAGSPPGVRAEALRAFVSRYIVHKDLATAFAGASAVVDSRAGDCTEHAVLLAALLRAQGIPSRLCSGLVYADHFGGKRGVFAWHMWTQALIDERWVDLDATDPTRAFHPGHVLIATSAQDDAQVDSDFVSLLGTIGNIAIEVMDVD